MHHLRSSQTSSVRPVTSASTTSLWNAFRRPRKAAEFGRAAAQEWRQAVAEWKSRVSMITPVWAPFQCRVEKVLVGVGQTVKEGDPLSNY